MKTKPNKVAYGFLFAIIAIIIGGIVQITQTIWSIGSWLIELI